MIKKNYFLKCYHKVEEDLLNFLTKEFHFFRQEAMNSSDFSGTGKRRFYVSKRLDNYWLLNVNSYDKVISERNTSTSANIGENKLRVLKHHFFFDITIEVQDCPTLKGGNSICFAYSAKEAQARIIEIGDVGIFALKTYRNGIKPLIIEEIVHATIIEFCKEMEIAGCEFCIKDYKYHFADSSDAAVYYTTLNCLAEIFGFKEKGGVKL